MDIAFARVKYPVITLYFCFICLLEQMLCFHIIPQSMYSDKCLDIQTKMQKPECRIQNCHPYSHIFHSKSIKKYTFVLIHIRFAWEMFFIIQEEFTLPNKWSCRENLITFEIFVDIHYIVLQKDASMMRVGRHSDIGI